ncbi:pyrimidine reductase family protein [Ruania zhangjianzhongii]|uniref:pyrimidine reductase family protein n=1 Tax=Ruania zhangjianzhongii TaxID=2603206 RepID=UPI00143DF307|nr:pyrimidine reductase family protein [Ruania zhangjianzhongii]
MRNGASEETGSGRRPPSEEAEPGPQPAFEEAEPGPQPAFEEAELLATYRVADRSRAHLRANMIASIDGAATHQGLSGGLNGPADKQVFDLLRRLADVIIVGAGTVRAEGYGAMRLTQEDVTWRRTQGLSDHPVFAIVSGRLDLDPSSPVFIEAPVRPLVFTHGGSPTAQRTRLSDVAEIVVCGAQELDPAAMRLALQARGLSQMLTEGGPRLLGTLAGAGVLDEICLTISPLLEGGDAVRITRDAPPVHTGMRLTGMLSAEDMVMLRYQR